MFEEYLSLFIKAVFVENMALSFFLGMCTFLAVSKRVETALGLGIAVIVVQTITVPTNYLIYNFILREGALSWAGMPEVDLILLGLITSVSVTSIFSKSISPSCSKQNSAGTNLHFHVPHVE